MDSGFWSSALVINIRVCLERTHLMGVVNIDLVMFVVRDILLLEW